MAAITREQTEDAGRLLAEGPWERRPSAVGLDAREDALTLRLSMGLPAAAARVQRCQEWLKDPPVMLRPEPA